MSDIRYNILKELSEVFIDVFNDKNLKISEESSQENTPNWDSLMHIQLILAIESKFGFSFSSSEMLDIKNVRQIIDIIINKSIA
jgi:acyl carrier protein